MSLRSRFLVVVMLLLGGLLLSIGLPAGFRSEDFLDLDRYARVGAVEAAGEPHLGSRIVTFWRPLADLVTWALVRTTGPDPWAVRLFLVTLHAAAAASVGWALRRLFGLGPRAALAASLIALAHPFGPAVTTYLDGGIPMLLVTIATFLALAALGRWREREGGRFALHACTVAAMLAHDAAVVVPVVICAVALILPRRERGVPWLLLSWIPALLFVKHLVVGRAFDGYRVLADPSWIPHFPRRLAACTWRLFVPAFPGELHPDAAGVVATAIFAAVAAGGAITAIVTRQGRWGPPLREALALAALVIGSFAMAAELFTASAAAVPDELVLAYRSVPAAFAASLAVGWLIGRAANRRGLASLALAAPWIGTLLWLRAPIASAHGEAIRWAGEIRAALVAHSDATGADRLLVQEVPVKTIRNGRSVARALQFGLSSALRPPLVGRERFVYPLFRVAEDGQLGWVSSETIEALAGAPWLAPLRCSFGDPVTVSAIERPRPPAGRSLRLFPAPDGVERAIGPDASDAPIVEVDPEGVIELGASGDAPGMLRLFALNRMHPCVAFSIGAGTPAAPAALFLERGPPAGSGVSPLRARALGWYLEIATRFPDDVVFLVLEAIPDPARTPGDPPAVSVSNVLPVRLRLAR